MFSDDWLDGPPFFRSCQEGPGTPVGGLVSQPGGPLGSYSVGRRVGILLLRFLLTRNTTHSQPYIRRDLQRCLKRNPPMIYYKSIYLLYNNRKTFTHRQLENLVYILVARVLVVFIYGFKSLCCNVK